MSIDDRIYRLQRSNVPADLKYILRQADKAFLQDDEVQASNLIAYLEIECEKRGIALYQDEYLYSNN
ncbi:hypothetical protein FY534_00140 [Alicyclobacillus sp. TC]|uniref:hypothetical protein n=1 Tax=Alicyclobacillus sp. TC TaxID=2606450 RepID=UPI0019313041|nr:hypothetical protein [Alicyclobacillus sp. TC]QRF22268.1 hypothetical protein FY534_00140 [Alicyclobacillus sp. TC]